MISVASEKNISTAKKYFGRTDGQTGKTVYPLPLRGAGGIIRSKIGSKCVDLILIRLAKCWNNINLPLKLFNFNLIWFFFLKKYFNSES
jgi:hypothetical protein